MSKPVLYILMRNDMDSLNPGKAMAQAAHAANFFQTCMEDENYGVNNLQTYALYEDWKSTTLQSFGTTIVLAVNSFKELEYHCEYCRKVPTTVCRLVFDPTYPVTDGKVTHSVPVITCGFIFGDKDNLKICGAMKGLELY